MSCQINNIATPRKVKNRRRQRIKGLECKLETISKCTSQENAHVNNATQILCIVESFENITLINIGPQKSTPQLVKAKSSDRQS